MKRLPAILICLVAVTVDASAVIIASDAQPTNPFLSWQLPMAMHLISVAMVGFAVARYQPRSDTLAPGARTLAILAVTLNFCAPVVGPLVIVCLLAGFANNAATVPTSADVIIGNPLRTSPTDASIRPLVDSLAANALDKLRKVGPLLHRNLSRPSINSLRQLQGHQDARTQLHAQGALTSLSEAVENQITQLRQSQASPENSRRLASLLHQVAISGMHDDASSKALLEEAIQHLDQALAASTNDAANITALQVLAECHLATDNVTAVPQLIVQLRSQTDGNAFADKIERQYHASLGQWSELTASTDATALDCSVAARKFWAGSSPAA